MVFFLEMETVIFGMLFNFVFRRFEILLGVEIGDLNFRLEDRMEMNLDVGIIEDLEEGNFMLCDFRLCVGISLYLFCLKLIEEISK